MKQVQSESEKLFNISEEHNKRIKEYTMLRMSFEYKKKVLFSDMRNKNRLANLQNMMLFNSEQPRGSNGEEDDLEFANLNAFDDSESYLFSTHENLGKHKKR